MTLFVTVTHYFNYQEENYAPDNRYAIAGQLA